MEVALPSGHEDRPTFIAGRIAEFFPVVGNRKEKTLNNYAVQGFFYPVQDEIW